jgi:hypothetical protein
VTLSEARQEFLKDHRLGYYTISDPADRHSVSCVLFHASNNAVSSSGVGSPYGTGYVIALTWLVIGLGLVMLDRECLNLKAASCQIEGGEE